MSDRKFITIFALVLAVFIVVAFLLVRHERLTSERHCRENDGRILLDSNGDYAGCVYGVTP